MIHTGYHNLSVPPPPQRERRKANGALCEAANLIQSKLKGVINLLQCLLTVYYLFFFFLSSNLNQRDRIWLSGIASMCSQITGRRKEEV